jgi:hypothetical protein
MLRIFTTKDGKQVTLNMGEFRFDEKWSYSKFERTNRKELDREYKANQKMSRVPLPDFKDWKLALFNQFKDDFKNIIRFKDIK